MKKINLLFTGGFDSTFRLCQLSRMEGVTVQPLYLTFTPMRPNEKKEIQAQETIISLLKAKSETKAVILSPIRINEKDLPVEPEYDNAYIQWNPSGRIPGQYRSMGKLALLYSPLEVGREGPTLRNRQRGLKVGKTRNFLEEHGVKFMVQPDGSVLTDFRRAEPGLEMLFGRYRYPILGISETAMVPFIKEWGYEDVFKHTWTCDFGNDEPCGVCHNCETKWDSGLVNFFNPHAVRNHEIKKFLEQLKDTLPEGQTPVELVGKDELPDVFSYFVKNNYKLDMPDSFLPYPEKIQQINYRFKLLRQENVTKYFNKLIQAWDQGRKGEYLATLN